MTSAGGWAQGGGNKVRGGERGGGGEGGGGVLDVSVFGKYTFAVSL